MIGHGEWVLGLATADCDLAYQHIPRQGSTKFAPVLHTWMESHGSYHNAAHGTGTTNSVPAYAVRPAWLASIRLASCCGSRSVCGLEDILKGSLGTLPVGLSRMHVPAWHWLAGTLTLGCHRRLSMAAGGSQSGAPRMKWRPCRSREANRLVYTDHLSCQGHHETRIFGGSTTFTHVLHGLQTQQHQRLRQIGTFKLGFCSLARNDATFQKNTGQCP